MILRGLREKSFESFDENIEITLILWYSINRKIIHDFYGGAYMTNQIYSAQQIQSILIPIFKEYNIRKAILFGSYAKGIAKDKSDIDLLVDSGLKGLAFFGLLEDVVTALGKDVDLLDTTQIIPDSEVYNEIAKTGVVIYEC